MQNTHSETSVFNLIFEKYNPLVTTKFSDCNMVDTILQYERYKSLKYSEVKTVEWLDNMHVTATKIIVARCDYPRGTHNLLNPGWASYRKHV